MLKDYVYVSELSKKLNIHPSYFYIYKKSKDKTDIIKVGSHLFIKKSILPPKYKNVAYNQCTKLDNLLPAAYVTRIFDLSKDYMSVVKHHKTSDLKIIKINNTNFVELNDDIIDKIQNMTPFRIRNKEDEQFAKYIFKFGYTKIGFYN